ncbi:MAG: 50S ribosomal protein L6 [Candidatus Bathyarchaeota archaeon BA2]|nr:MAG: 50S ribosomal protein L6 [Candidatus Bathyarchaeota archaeon BA2]
MRAVETVKSIEIPEGVLVKVEGRVVTVNGEKGELTQDFSHTPISIRLEGKTITVQANWPRKKETALIGTVGSHIQNMITGVTKGFTYKLKIVFSHFPISVKVRERTVAIENFTGERSPRIAKIIGDTKVMVKSEDIIVQGTNIGDVSQTAANIQNATKVKKKDPRVFLDGIYVYERHEGMEE